MLEQLVARVQDIYAAAPRDNRLDIPNFLDRCHILLLFLPCTCVRVLVLSELGIREFGHDASPLWKEPAICMNPAADTV